MSANLPRAYTRCHGYDCDERKTCERHRQIKRDERAWENGDEPFTQPQVMRLRPDNGGPCDLRIVETQA